ncbi:unnamed protein product [Brachionus calyciflorus]|uniref:Major facilitator superfamily (MFS) profile domain-containing protein n=1 Tax=Brachionus calyciflorus TaxID=104777 RepID=A0A814FQQ9_9BILA|nr:unnamed protein product [Brachionus calyciflorus]
MTKTENVEIKNKFKKPDGGYGWIILISISFSHFILIGCMYSFGIILKSIKSDFDVTQDIANLLQSLNVGFLYASGSLSSALAKEFGYRKVVMVSALIFASMFALSAFLKSFYLMIFTFGFIGGISYGCTYLTCFVALVEYFDKKLGLATGIIMASAGFGAFAFAPLSKSLLSHFGWKYTMIIFGGIVLTIFFFAILLRPIEYYKMKFLQQEGETQSLTQETSEIEEKKSFILTRILKEIFNFRLLIEDKIFLLVVLSAFFVFSAYYIPFIYIPIRAQNLNIKEYAWIISTAGITNIPIRLLFGYLCDKKFLRAIHMNTLCLVVATIAMFSYYFLTSLKTQLIFAVIFAFPMAGIHCLSTPYLVDIVGSAKFRNANGILNTFRGMGAILGPFIAGLLSEKYGSMFYSFIFAGAVFTLAMVLSLTASILFSLKIKKSKKINFDIVL